LVENGGKRGLMGGKDTRTFLLVDTNFSQVERFETAEKGQKERVGCRQSQTQRKFSRGGQTCLKEGNCKRRVARHQKKKRTNKKNKWRRQGWGRTVIPFGMTTPRPTGTEKTVPTDRKLSAEHPTRGRECEKKGNDISPKKTTKGRIQLSARGKEKKNEGNV